MQVSILGAESMGARSLCVSIQASWGTVLIDPGVALSPHRFSQQPHPLEFAAARQIRNRITQAAATAQTLIVSHYHFDHYTPYIPRLYGFSDEETAAALYKDKRLLVKARSHHINFSQKKRSYHLFKRDDLTLIEADGETFDNLTFSKPFFHGEYKSKLGFVFLVLVEDGSERFIYGSDIQCLNDRPIDWILEKEPSIVIVSGPPIYLKVLEDEDKAYAREQLIRLAEQIPIVVVDHHLTRDPQFMEYVSPIAEVAQKHGHKIQTAAEYMGQPNHLLEAHRLELYEKYPIDDTWHQGLFDKDPAILKDLDRWETELDNLEQLP